MYKPKRKKSKLQVFEERGELLKLKKEKNKFLQFYRANDGNGKFSRISKWRAIGGGGRRRKVELRLQQFRNDTSRMQVGTCYEASN